MKLFLIPFLIFVLSGVSFSQTVVMKDGTKLEASKIVEDGGNLNVQTKYGTLSVSKAEVDNLGALGFNSGATAAGPRTNGQEFVSELLPEGIVKMDYYLNREKIGSQLYTNSGSLLKSEGKIGDGEYKEFYSDGKVKKEKMLIDGQNNGAFKTYYPTGVLQSEAYFIGGKITGGHKIYSASGKIFSERNYIDGVLNGYSREYDENGVLKSQVQYVNGEPRAPGEVLAPRQVPVAEAAPASSIEVLGKSDKRNSFFLEGEIFTVGGADKEWKQNVKDAVLYLGSVYDYARGEITTYPGLGITAGLNLTPYKKSPVYLAASYVKGPSAEIEVSISDSYWGTGTYSEDIETSFYRLMVGYRLVLPVEGGRFFTFDANLGSGGGKIESEWSTYVSGGAVAPGSASESWTGLTWSIGPSFSWESPGYIFEIGGRYTVFPALEDSDTFSDVKWRPFSLKASFLF